MFYVCVLTAFWDKSFICDTPFHVFVSFGKASVLFSLSEITNMGVGGTDKRGDGFISFSLSQVTLKQRNGTKHEACILFQCELS